MVVLCKRTSDYLTHVSLEKAEFGGRAEEGKPCLMVVLCKRTSD